MFSSIIFIIGGLIATSSLIIAKKPDAQELLDKITPYQGWIGVLLTIWGVMGLINSIRTISTIGLVWGVLTAAFASCFVVGFLLAYSLISKYILEKDETAKIKGQALRNKLVKFQIPAGVILIVLGVLTLVYH